MEGLLRDVEKIESAIPGLAPDECRLLQIRLALLYDAATQAATRTLSCPGLYWRRRPEVREAIEQRRESNKRFRLDVEQTDCPHAENPTAATWARHYVGPPRERPPDGADTRRALCDMCGQVYGRDKKKGLLDPK